MSLLDRPFGDVLCDAFLIFVGAIILLMMSSLFLLLLLPGALAIELLFLLMGAWNLRGKVISAWYKSFVVDGIWQYLKSVCAFLTGEPFRFKW